MAMVIKRDKYINELLSKRWNGKVKIITGIRRCGKSFLLSTLYKDYLRDEGVQDDCFVEIALDRKAHVKYRNPNELYEYVLEQTQDESKRYYVFIDEIQLSFKVKNEDVDEKLIPEEDKDMLYTTFYDILNDLMARSNLDVYVTGSNSKMLSKDIVTNFRDRGTEVKVYPLSFKEFYAVSGLEKTDALEEYLEQQDQVDSQTDSQIDHQMDSQDDILDSPDFESDIKPDSEKAGFIDQSLDSNTPGVDLSKPENTDAGIEDSVLEENVPEENLDNQDALQEETSEQIPEESEYTVYEICEAPGLLLRLRGII